MTRLSPSDLNWFAARLSIAVYDTIRDENNEMSIMELRNALKDIPGIETLTLGYSQNGNQLLTLGDYTCEVSPMASNEEIRIALQNPFIKTENTTMSITGAKFLADQIRTQLAATKAQLAQAGSEMSAAMSELQATADEATKQVKDVQAETADLKAALGLNSNGGPTE